MPFACAEVFRLLHRRQVGLIDGPACWSDLRYVSKCHTVVCHVQIIAGSRATSSVAVIYSGTVPFDFRIDLKGCTAVSVNPSAGSVSPGQRTTVGLTYAPATSHRLLGQKITCHVVHGPTYTLRMTGGRASISKTFTTHHTSWSPHWYCYISCKTYTQNRLCSTQ